MERLNKSVISFSNNRFLILSLFFFHFLSFYIKLVREGYLHYFNSTNIIERMNKNNCEILNIINITRFGFIQSRAYISFVHAHCA